jgi:hypothetical protein
MEYGAGAGLVRQPAGLKDLYPIYAECSRRKEPSGELEFKSLNVCLELGFRNEKGSGRTAGALIQVGSWSGASP